MIKIAYITVELSKQEEYKQILKEEIEASLRLEEGVEVLYAVWDKEHVNRFTILEKYKNQDAYDRHFVSPHLQKYFTEVKDMVLHLEIMDAMPLIDDLRMK